MVNRYGTCEITLKWWIGAWNLAEPAGIVNLPARMKSLSICTSKKMEHVYSLYDRVAKYSSRREPGRFEKILRAR